MAQRNKKPEHFQHQKQSQNAESEHEHGTNKPIFGFLGGDYYTSLIIFIALICGFLALLCCLLCCCCYKRRRNVCDPECQASPRRKWFPFRKSSCSRRSSRSLNRKRGKKPDKSSYECLNDDCPSIVQCDKYQGRGSCTSICSKSRKRSVYWNDQEDHELICNDALKMKICGGADKKEPTTEKEESKHKLEEEKNKEDVKILKSKKSTTKTKRKEEKIKHKSSWEKKNKKREREENEKSVVLTFKLDIPSRKQIGDPYLAPPCESPHNKYILTDSSTTDWQEIKEDSKDLKLVQQKTFTKFTAPNDLQVKRAEISTYLFQKNMQAERLARGDSSNLTYPQLTPTISKMNNFPSSNTDSMLPLQKQSSFQTIPEKLSKNLDTSDMNVPINDVFGKDSLEILNELKDLEQTNTAEKDSLGMYNFNGNGEEQRTFSRFSFESNCYNK